MLIVYTWTGVGTNAWIDDKHWQLTADYRYQKKTAYAYWYYHWLRWGTRQLFEI